MYQDIKITVTEADRDHVQRLAIETEARQNIISFMLANDMDVSGEQFKKYQAEYTDFYRCYERAKKELEKKYVLPAVNGADGVKWQLDFDNRELTVTVPEVGA